MQELNDIKGTRQPENSKLESQRQNRAAEKASRDEHDLAKARNVNKQQREDEEASTRNTEYTASCTVVTASSCEGASSA